MPYIYQNEDGVEPISDTFGEQATNAGIYSVVAPQLGGCALTYSGAALTVALAAGNIVHYGSLVAVAAAPTAYTLVPDPSNPRWAWLAIDSTGMPVYVAGVPAVAPAVPELGDNVAVGLVYINAALTIASSASYRLDKRVPTPGGSYLVAEYNTATATTSTSVVDLVAISGLNIPTNMRFRVVHNFRKTNSAAQAVAFGIKVNSTVIYEAAVAGGNIRSSASSLNENGWVEYTFNPRSTANYLSGMDYRWASFNLASGSFTISQLADAAASTAPGSPSNNMPNAAVTSITIRAINGTSNNNAEVYAVRVYADL